MPGGIFFKKEPMDKTFKLMNPVQWHEGLLLYPQHFQQMRREFQELALCYLSVAMPYYWGVRSVVVDEGAFATGLLRLKSIVAVMPDGSVLDHDEGSSQKIELQLRDYQELLDQGSLTIHLAVVRYQPHGPLVGGDFPRYDSEESPPLADENTGEGALPIPRLALKAFLIAGDHIPVRYAGFPIFKIRAHDGGFVFDDFIAPATDCRSNGKIGAFGDAVVRAMRKNGALLSDKLQAPVTQDTALILDQYKKNYDTLISCLLGLEALVHAEVTHPFTLYKELCDIAGVFCGFSRGCLPPIFDAYDHNDLKKTFGPVLAFIDQMLEFVKGVSSSFAFRLENRIFKSILKPEWLLENDFILGITLSSGIGSKSTADWTREAVIASESMAQKAVERRVLGAQRTLVDQVPELGLTMTKGKLLLRVSSRSEYIKPGEELFVFNVSDTQGAHPAEVVLHTAAE